MHCFCELTVHLCEGDYFEYFARSFIYLHFFRYMIWFLEISGDLLCSFDWAISPCFIMFLVTLYWYLCIWGNKNHTKKLYLPVFSDWFHIGKSPISPAQDSGKLSNLFCGNTSLDLCLIFPEGFSFPFFDQLVISCSLWWLPVILQVLKQQHAAHLFLSSSHRHQDYSRSHQEPEMSQSETSFSGSLKS